MGKYNMYAYAHARDTRVIDIVSLGDWHNEISEKTKVESGVISNIGNVFEKINKPAPFYFIWVPNKHISKTLFTSLKPGEDFSLDMRIQIREGDDLKSRFYFNFAQCKYQKSQIRGGKVKVFASFGYFDVK